jgi:murein DD-endopeptidase MepM/ murein hydrolase activator NlpD
MFFAKTLRNCLMNPKISFKISPLTIIKDLHEFLAFIRNYFRSRMYGWFAKFEVFKNLLVDILYKKRGRYVRPFLHFGTVGLVFFAIIVGPVILSQDRDEQQQVQTGILSASAYGMDFYTREASEVGGLRRGEIIVHVVEEGETISNIAELYSLNQDTIFWENNLTASSTISPGDELNILPIDGVRHRVSRGETVFSIGRRYGLTDSQIQAIVDYPFNDFLNDETFELAIGQQIMVPGGTPPRRIPTRPTTPTTPTEFAPVAASGTGQFVWPTSGGISQGYSFYHRALDISNRGGGPILAADSGTVVASGWDSSGYGNRIVIDHGNGFVTLYAHLSVLQVSPGQRVNRGAVIGQMGSTGRSTGVHLHFEIRQGGVYHNPFNFLR